MPLRPPILAPVWTLIQGAPWTLPTREAPPLCLEGVEERTGPTCDTLRTLRHSPPTRVPGAQGGLGTNAPSAGPGPGREARAPPCSSRHDCRVGPCCGRHTSPAPALPAGGSPEARCMAAAVGGQRGALWA